MFNRLTIIILFFVALSACNQRGKYYAPGKKDSSVNISKTDSTTRQTKKPESGFNEKELQLFCNIEMAPYCVLLPLNDFKEDFSDKSVIKAQHKFLLKKDTANFTSIEVQAFTIDKKNNYNTSLFFKRDKNDIEEGGLGIDTAYINEANHFYVIKGYLPNYMNMKFVQVNWILEDRVAIYFNYDEKDEALWNDRIAAIIKRGVAYANQ
ncbi:MAG: hypothetical protein JNM14_07845 [Ferruginibacter sp.]|nr:hypothetical protein [Ferruginibacter sp.]